MDHFGGVRRNFVAEVSLIYLMYAHTAKLANGKTAPPERWEHLYTGSGDGHLERVAAAARSFAEAFHAGDFAELAGLYHDVGKFAPGFQEYLLEASDLHQAEITMRVDHSTAGAQFLAESLPVWGVLLAYLVAGHHAGLPEGRNEKASSLEHRLSKDLSQFGPWRPAAEAALPDFKLVPPPAWLAGPTQKKDGFAFAFFTRFLYSCLVDADFLETEAFMSPTRSQQRPVQRAEVLQMMADAVDAFVDAFGPPEGNVNQQRARVRNACLEKSHAAPGLFSLTVPTGGGKTLASLTFALRHAIEHSQKRIIYVIPFTSIIEQNAKVFRDVFRTASEQLGFELVLEHHCNLNPDDETVESRLATENWDAPLIVTTHVQFYESLFARRTSRCRKLHRIAQSVVILDEAQCLPVDYLAPCLQALRELTDHYGTSVVLCTATQPAVLKSPDFPIGLEGVREIIDDPKSLSLALERTRLEGPVELDDAALAAALLAESQVLCIVNTRRHAQSVFAQIDPDQPGHFHLSALMCPAHRKETLRQVEAQLARTGSVCRLIATNLIEAGVDIDFPVVYRSLAGLDSVAQAAGRCNRHGGLEIGRVVLFKSEHADSKAEAFLRETTNVTNEVLEIHEQGLSLEAIEQYFRLYYWEQKDRWDEKMILDQFRLDVGNAAFPFDFGFRTVAERFRLIEHTYRPVVVPWRQAGKAICEEFRSEFKPTRELYRKLQQYTVQIPGYAYAEFETSFEMIHDIAMATGAVLYDEKLGLMLGEEGIFLNG